jgi:hypothetical protein
LKKAVFALALITWQRVAVKNMEFWSAKYNLATQLAIWQPYGEQGKTQFGVVAKIRIRPFRAS